MWRAFNMADQKAHSKGYFYYGLKKSLYSSYC